MEILFKNTIFSKKEKGDWGQEVDVGLCLLIKFLALQANGVYKGFHSACLLFF